MAREDGPKKLEKGKSLFEQSEEIEEGEYPQLLFDNGYMLTHASPDNLCETYITKEACEDHGYHYVVCFIQRKFVEGEIYPGQLVFIFSTWNDLTRAVPIDISRMKKLDFQLVIDAASTVEKIEQATLNAVQRKLSSRIITPEQWRAMKDRKRFGHN